MCDLDSKRGMVRKKFKVRFELRLSEELGIFCTICDMSTSKNINREVKTIFLSEIDGFFLALCVCDLDSKRGMVRKKFKVRFELRLSEELGIFCTICDMSTSKNINREVKTIFLSEIDGFFLALCVCCLNSKRRRVRKKFEVRF